MEKLLTIIRYFVFSVYVSVSAGDPFQFNISDDGSYSLHINGKKWLENGPIFVNGYGKTWSAGSKYNPLVLENVTKVSGGDKSEQWHETQFTYRLGTTNTTVIAAVRLYSGSVFSSRILFTQTFPSGVVDTRGSELSLDKALSGFPCFRVKDPEEKLGYLSYGGAMFGDSEKSVSTFDSKSKYINDGIKGGPLALFNKGGQSVVISPYNHFMAASLWHDKDQGHVAWGIMSGVNDTPANFSYSTLLMFDNGINQAFDSWGFILRKQFGLQNTMERKEKIQSDLSLNYLGYWTDNGAYYYYHPEDKKTFEETMLDVKKYADDNLIPYKYLQLDSWWYPKDKDGAVLTWTPMSNIFPDGIKYVSDKTNWPIAAHNRYWSKKTPYAKINGGNFTFVMGEKGSVPDDQMFWNYLLSQARNWGLFLYEQDWLYVQGRDVEALETNLTLGRDWLTQMATGAAKNNQTIQYCMSYPRHALQTLELPVVTQARVSGDYLARYEQWRVGVSSIFARAMGIRPYKDTFWTTSVQPGNPYHKMEIFPELEAVVASLTSGPVGPSDMINGTNIKLLMRCCRNDGRLLKPSRPATATDKQIMTNAFGDIPSDLGGEVWSTQSFIKTHYNSRGQVIEKEYGILFAASVLLEPYYIRVDELGFRSLSEGIYFPYDDVTKWQNFTSTTVIDLKGCNKGSLCLYYFAPNLNSTSQVQAILGETEKWVPMSADRIDYVSVGTEGSVDVIFNPVDVNERLNVSYILGDKLYTRECALYSGTQSKCRLYGP